MSEALQKTFALRLPLNRVPWFDVLVSAGRLDVWLRSKNIEEFQYAINVMAQPEILKHRSEQVAGRIRVLLENKELTADQRRLVLRVFSNEWVNGSEALFEIFLTALKRGDIESERQDWGMRFYRLPEQHPKRAVEIVEAIFDLANRTPSSKGPDLSRIGFPDGFVGQIARRVPEVFAKAFLPRLISLMLQNKQTIRGISATDTVWPVLLLGMDHNLKWILLDRLAEALGIIAGNNTEVLDSMTKDLEGLELRNVGYLLLSAWTQNAKHYADRICKYLLEHRDFLELGYASWGEGNGHAAIARAAVSGATKYCSESSLQKLEEAILQYYPAVERDEPKRFGYVQALLLHAIDQERIGLKARVRMEELDRKFPKLDISPPESSKGFELVGSPIPKNALPKMSDENWLSAMARYHAGTEEEPAAWLLGGVHQLSGDLEAVTRRDKRRFAKIALQMGADFAPSYFDAILRGLVASKDEQNNNASLPSIEPSLLYSVLIHIHNLPSRPSGQWMMSAISAVSDWKLPNEVLDIVNYHAINGSTPTDSGGLTGSSYGGNLVNHGINTVRGAAADCLARLLFREHARWPALERAVHHVVFDESWSVRAVSIRCLTAMLNIDRQLAVDWFVQSAEKNNALLSSMFVPRFLQLASQSHYEALHAILRRMLQSENGDAREGGAQAIAIASFRVAEALEDLTLVRTSSEEARAAWMEVAAENLGYGAISDRCREWLQEGFFDTSQKVREVASRCFHKLSSDQLCTETALIDAFLKSPAFEHASTFLLMALEKAVDRLPDIVCRIPERALAIYRAQGDRDQRPWWTHQMSTLVLRLYNQTRNPLIRRRCLDAIDQMIELGSGEVAAELEKIERN